MTANYNLHLTSRLYSVTVMLDFLMGVCWERNRRSNISNIYHWWTMCCSVRRFLFFFRTVSFRSRVLPPNSVWMEDAKLKGLEICHPQVRGGDLWNMRTDGAGWFLLLLLFSVNWWSLGFQLLVGQSVLVIFSSRCFTHTLQTLSPLVNYFMFLSVCVDQERNIFNRIFGGFLMRKAYELGWANACSYGWEMNTKRWIFVYMCRSVLS